MNASPYKPYFIFSIVLHVILVSFLLIGFHFSGTKYVIENTNKNDIISAVVLGDTAKSKILPYQTPAPVPVHKQVVKEEKPKEMPKPEAKQKAEIKPKPPVVKKDVIALKIKEKKQRQFADDLLADIKKQSVKQKKLQQKKLEKQFAKMLQQQAEKSLRQQLLNEEIKLRGTESRQSQGEVNKYKALILQVISQHWIIPPQARKDLYCELMVRLAPGGMVLDVQITKTSSDPALDNSARAAVLKASPLPVPSNPDEFSAFRQFVLKVRPDNILAENSGL